MKVGLIARAEDRGLGQVCREWFRHMMPDRTLVVVPAGVTAAGLPSHLDWYPDADVVWLDGPDLPEETCRRFLTGLDVVYSAETFYDWRFCEWARQAAVATVCHAMPEWLDPAWIESPTVWWAPTSWRLDTLPAATRLVPVPIPTDRWTGTTRPAMDGAVRWLHVAGAPTRDDRNGTGAFMAALPYLTEPHDVTVRSQAPLDVPSAPHQVRVRTLAKDERRYWHLYGDADVMVLPRRYGGLSMPVLEAFGAGLAVVMSDASPQADDWPVVTVPCTAGEPLQMLCEKKVLTWDTDPVALAALMDDWARDRQRLGAGQVATRDFASSQSWETLGPIIRAELARVVEAQHR